MKREGKRLSSMAVLFDYLVVCIAVCYVGLLTVAESFRTQWHWCGTVFSGILMQASGSHWSCSYDCRFGLFFTTHNKGLRSRFGGTYCLHLQGDVVWFSVR